MDGHDSSTDIEASDSKRFKDIDEIKNIKDASDALRLLEEDEEEDAALNEGFHADLQDVLKKLYENQTTEEEEAQVRRIIWEENPTRDSSSDIMLCGKVLCGKEEDWCSPSREANDFRHLMSLSHEIDTSNHKERYPNEKSHPPVPARWLVDVETCLFRPRHEGFMVEIKVVTLPDADDKWNNLYKSKMELKYKATANEMLEHVFDRFQGRMPQKDRTAESFIFKHPDQNQFLFGDVPMQHFRYIRDTCSQFYQTHPGSDEKPFLRLNFVEHLYRPEAKESHILELTYPKLEVHEPVYHEHITTRSDTEPDFPTDPALTARFISVWDIDQPVQIVINGLSNINLPSGFKKARHIDQAGADLLVAVIAELTYGGTKLGSTMQTPWRVIKNANADKVRTIMWGEPSGRLVWEDLKVSDIPRETRLCLSVLCVNPTELADNQQNVGVKEKNVLFAAVKGGFSLGQKAVNILNPATHLKKEDSVYSFLGWVNTLLFDHYGYMLEGNTQLPIWPEQKKANPIGVVSRNRDSRAVILHAEFPRFPKRVIFPKGEPPAHKFRELEEKERRDDTVLSDSEFWKAWLNRYEGREEIATMEYIVALYGADPLYKMSDVDKIILWKSRRMVSRLPRVLPKFLQAVDWCKPAAVYETQVLLHGGEINYYRERLANHHSLFAHTERAGRAQSTWQFEKWNELNALSSLELLDARFPDCIVRDRVIEFLQKMSEVNLANFILQLVQVLKYETYHYSALARFLLRKALESPYVVGQPFFWHLKAEMQDPKVMERHGLLLQEFVKRSYTRRDLLKQGYMVAKVLKAAIQIKDVDKPKRKEALHAMLREYDFPPVFTLPLDSRMEVTTIRIEKCKVMDSKKVPLWIVFRTTGEEDLRVIFKAGDDLRQDLLTLQILSIMDGMWKNHGLDLCLRPYGCIATAVEVGMIEVVDNADTVAGITRDYGDAKAAYYKEPLLEWLKKNNEGQLTQFKRFTKTQADDDLPPFIDNFVRSCAGYAPATFILGIGDRHNDNIMLQRTGVLFHIDFGHFLGNFKEKFGFKRETSPFVFTPMYAHVMGGKGAKQYKRWCKLSCKALNVIRENAALLINLFNLMLSTGIPELQKPEDIDWLKSVLLLPTSLTEKKKTYREVETYFLGKIEESLNDKRAVFNDYIHIMAH